MSAEGPSLPDYVQAVSPGATCYVCGRRGPCACWNVEDGGVLGSRFCLRWPPRSATGKRAVLAELLRRGKAAAATEREVSE